MIIKLKNADFSTKNIGMINLKRDLSSETKAIIAKFTRTLSRDQQFALQDMTDSLKEAGLWGKISNLYMPILAGAVGESLTNIKTLSVDATPDSAIYTIDSNGLNKAAGSSESSIVLLNGSQQNLHLLGYNTTVLPANNVRDHESDVIAGAMNNSDGTLTIARYAFDKYGQSLCYTGVGTSAKTVSLNAPSAVFVLTPCFHGVSQTTLGNIAMGYGTNIALKETPIDADGTYTDFPVRILGTPTHSLGAYGTWGLFSIGSGLSLTECKTYQGIVDTFMDAMGVFVN